MFNARPVITPVAIAPGAQAWMIDDALLEPQRWVEMASQHRQDFSTSPHNAYPGVELRMPDPITARLDEFFAQSVRSRLCARRTQRAYSRLSLATRRPEQLQPRQWICHRDRLQPEPGLMTAACVLYLFHDEALGGTAFYRPKKPPQETALMIHESGLLPAAEFSAKYGIEAGYQRASNDWFEKTASIAPRWNRLVFYDGGATFHSSDIAEPHRLTDDPHTGRLTLNGFFVCRSSAR